MAGGQDGTGRAFSLTPLAQSLTQPLAALLADIENVLTLQPRFDAAADTRTFTAHQWLRDRISALVAGI